MDTHDGGARNVVADDCVDDSLSGVGADSFALNPFIRVVGFAPQTWRSVAGMRVADDHAIWMLDENVVVVGWYIFLIVD